MALKILIDWLQRIFGLRACSAPCPKDRRRSA